MSQSGLKIGKKPRVKRKFKLLERLKEKPLPLNKKYTLSQIREFVKNRAYVLRVYDSPKDHDFLQQQRYDPLKTPKEIWNHWIELSKMELRIAKPQFVGLPVLREHMGNDPDDPGYRPQISGTPRIVGGVVVGVEMDNDGNTDVIVRCYPNSAGEWLCTHLETCFQGASIQHTRTPGEYDVSLREISLVLLGRHKNTHKLRFIDLINPEPLENFPIVYQHLPLFDFSKHEEFVRNHPKGEEILSLSTIKNEVQTRNFPKLVALSSVISNFSLLEDFKNTMSNSSETSVPSTPMTGVTSTSPVSASASVPTTTPSSSALPVSTTVATGGAGASGAPVAPVAAGTPGDSAGTGNATSAVAGIAATLANAIGAAAVGGGTAELVQNSPMDTTGDANANGGAARGIKRGLDTSSSSSSGYDLDASANGNGSGDPNKRSRTNEQGSDRNQILADIEACLERGLPGLHESNEPFIVDLLEKITNLKAEYLYTKDERDLLKKDETFFKSQLEDMHGKFFDDLQNIVAFVMANYSDPDQEVFQHSKQVDPRSYTVSDMMRNLGPILSRASSNVDIYQSVSTKRVLTQKGAPTKNGSILGLASATGTMTNSANASNGVATVKTYNPAVASAPGTVAPIAQVSVPATAAAPAAPALAAATTPLVVATASSHGGGNQTQAQNQAKAQAQTTYNKNSASHKALDRFMTFRDTRLDALDRTRAARVNNLYQPPQRSYPQHQEVAPQTIPTTSAQTIATPSLPAPTLSSAMSDPSSGSGSGGASNSGQAQPITGLASAVTGPNYGSVIPSVTAPVSSKVGGGLKAMYQQLRQTQASSAPQRSADTTSYGSGSGLGSGSGSGASGGRLSNLKSRIQSYSGMMT